MALAKPSMALPPDENVNRIGTAIDAIDANTAAIANTGNALNAEITARAKAVSDGVNGEAIARGQAIEAATAQEVQARSAAISSAINAEAVARGAAISDAVNAEAIARGAQIELTAAVEAKARIKADTALDKRVTDTASALNGRIDAKLDAADAPPILMSALTRGRVGEAPERYTTAGLSGAALKLAPLDPSLVATSDAGLVCRASGYVSVALRAPVPIEYGRALRFRWAFQRRSDTPDPSNDTVRAVIVWLDRFGNALPGKTGLTVVSERRDFLVASGRRTAEATVAAIAGQAQIKPPYGAAFARPAVQIFGSTSLVDVETIDWSDISDARILPDIAAGVVDDVGALKSADLPPRVQALESAVQNPNSLTFASKADAISATISPAVTTVLLRGLAEAGDAGGGLYTRVAAPAPGVDSFTSQDGAIWQYVTKTINNRDIALVTATALRFERPENQAQLISLQRKLLGYLSIEDVLADSYTAGGDDTDYVQALIDIAWTLGGGIADVRRPVRVLRDLYMRPNVTVRGPYARLGAPGSNSSQPYTGMMLLRLGPDATIHDAPGAVLNGFIIYQDGLPFPALNESQFDGTAITGASDDFTLVNSMVVGFTNAYVGANAGRLTLENVLCDCTNGFSSTNSLDVKRGKSVHCWPFITIAAVAQGLPGASLARSGTAFSDQSIADGTTYSDCFSYGYHTGFKVADASQVTYSNCWADHYPGLDNGAAGFSAEGNSHLIYYLGCRASSGSLGFYSSMNPGLRAIYVACEAHTLFSRGWLIEKNASISIVSGYVENAPYAVSLVDPSVSISIDIACRNIAGLPVQNIGKSPFVILAPTCDFVQFAGPSPMDDASLPNLAINAPASQLALSAHGRAFQVVGNGAIGSIIGGYPGREIVLLLTGGTNGQTIYNSTSGNGVQLKSGANLVLPANFLMPLRLIFAQSRWFEV